MVYTASNKCAKSCYNRTVLVEGKKKGKVHTLDIAPPSAGTSLQKRSGMARVVDVFRRFTRTPARLSTNAINHACLCPPSRSRPCHQTEIINGAHPRPV